MDRKVRFGDLVRNSGRPQFVTLWTAPEKDRVVSRAIKENRMLTVHEEPDKKPFGLVGLKPGPHAMFLIFPRRLTIDQNARVIGINYQLAEQPEIKAAIRAAPRGRAMPRKAH